MADPLLSITQMASAAIAASEIQARTQAENIANAKTAGFVPGAVSFNQVLKKDTGTRVVEAAAPTKLTHKTKKIYDPTHPMADGDGMVTMPDVDPLVTLLDMQKTSQFIGLNTQVKAMAQDLLYRKISQIKGKR